MITTDYHKQCKNRWVTESLETQGERGSLLSFAIGCTINENALSGMARYRRRGKTMGKPSFSLSLKPHLLALRSSWIAHQQHLQKQGGRVFFIAKKQITLAQFGITDG